jgi:hypothetical protein
MTFCPNGTLITWCSYKKKIVALSSCEAEFMAATIEAMQALWLRNLLSEITVTPPSKRGQIQVKHVNTEEQKADTLTKALSAVKLGVISHFGRCS